MGIDEHVKRLGGFLILLGILGGAAAIVGLLIFGSPLTMIAEAAEEGTADSMTIPFVKMFAATQIIIALLLAIPSILAGTGLRRFQAWGRDVAMVVSVLLLALIPLGTVLGLYSFWVILSPEIEPLFARRISY